ncbi:MAG TPA: NAD(P)/FAD-dependent oxidoreductase [Roseiarcus sp.]|nr:NAD(P)/FAD-dependent oxidoreductase [Roseiarcus sp.]
MSAEASTHVRAWTAALTRALNGADAGSVGALFERDGFWRDILAFTWTILTFEGREAIEAMVLANSERLRPIRFELDGAASEDGEEAFLRVETRIGRGRGHVRLQRGLARTLLTTLEELAGHEERLGDARPLGIVHEARRGRRTWLEERQTEEAELGRARQPYCVIVGGGQGGIALGARLKQLGVPTLIVEANERPGDTWRKRYKSLVLHDPVWYDHLPYLPFPAHWPVFAPKDQIADWLEAYVKVMGLNYWGGATCRRAEFEDSGKTWRLLIERGDKTVELRPRHFVLATGSYGKPRRPEIEGAAAFGGPILHSADYRSGKDFAGKACLVLGSNSSAHDICADLWEHDAIVTMIQRSPTTVVRSETLMEFGFKDLYSEEAVAKGMTTDKADLLFASIPFRLMPERQRELYRRIQEIDAPFYAALAKTGFLLDWGEDESGLMMKALRTGSGYYIDVGCSRLIIEGEVKVRPGVGIASLSPARAHLSDGSSLPADALILATGYDSMTTRLAEMASAEIVDRVGPNWGYGSGFRNDPGPWLGELRNMWKPLPQEALWCHGGNLHLSRFYSKFVALQIKARMEGFETPVYAPTC